MVQRLAKGVLPANTQIQKDALLAMTKSATVFVNYLTQQYVSTVMSPYAKLLTNPYRANENAMNQHKKTIQPGDVMDAIKELEYDGFLPRLVGELESARPHPLLQHTCRSQQRPEFNTVQCDKRNTYRRKVKAEKAAATHVEVAVNGAATNGHVMHDGEVEDAPAAKKVRLGSADGGMPVNGHVDEVGEDGDEGDEDEEEHEQDQGDEESEVEDDGIDEDEGHEDTTLAEDPLEIRDEQEEDGDEVLDGDESD